MDESALEDRLAHSLFKAGMSLIQSAIEHAAGEKGNPTQRAFFHRELDRRCRGLSPELYGVENPLQSESNRVIDSASG